MLNQIDLSRSDLNLLVLFESIMEHRHVARAADRLNLSPSAVSHGLGRLRRMLNDPLFLRTPKGVTPTARALELSQPIAEILARIRDVIGQAAAFDPATSARRFVIAAPDGVLAVLAPPLIDRLRESAAKVDIGFRQLLPGTGDVPDQAWRGAFSELEVAGLDLAILPIETAPLRFDVQPLWREDFVVACRPNHPFASRRDLQTFCDADHLVVSQTGDPRGFVDQALAVTGRSRRVALTAPNFMFAAALLSGGDYLCALPRRMALHFGPLMGFVAVDPPLPLPAFSMCLVASRAALADAGVLWLSAQVRAIAK